MGKKVEQAVNYVGKAIEQVVKNPLPLIETIALSAVGVPPSVAAAVVSAANGGDMKQIATSAIAAGVGGQVAGQAGEAATSAGASTELAKVASSAAGASSATVTAALASGQPLDKALEAGLTSGALSGATTGVIEAGKSALVPPETGQGIKAVPGAGTQLLGDQTSVSGLGLTEKVPTGGGQGLTVDPATALYTSQLAAPSTGKVRGTEEGGLQPAYTSAKDIIAPSTLDKTLAPDTGYKEPKTVTQTQEPVISKTTEQLARPVVSGALSELFGLGAKVPGAPSAGGSYSLAATPSAGITTGLAGERGAGELESKETGKERQNVWNEASLRLKDALGV